MEILKIEDLSFSYPNEKEDTLRGVSLSVREGEFLLVIGGTGSGKTTLLRHLKPELSPRGEKREGYCSAAKIRRSFRPESRRAPLDLSPKCPTSR